MLDAAVIPFGQKGQTNGALTGVMGDGIRYKSNAAFAGSLLHNRGFADARRAHQQDRTLMNRWNQIGSIRILGQICFDRVDNFLFGT